MKKTLFAFLFTILLFPCYSQNDLRVTVSALSDFSYAGSSLGFTLGLNKWKHQLYTGLKMPYTLFPTTVKTGSGFISGYRYYLKNPLSRSNGFINFDYQVALTKSYGYSSENRNLNFLHQLNLSYGVQYKVFNSLAIGSSIGAGFFINNMYVRTLDSRNNFKGFDGLLRMFLIYEL